jgi:hypothetical protein
LLVPHAHSALAGSVKPAEAGVPEQPGATKIADISGTGKSNKKPTVSGCMAGTQPGTACRQVGGGRLRRIP